MWFGASRVTGIGVGGSGSLVGGVSAFVRHFSRKRAENLRKINPRVPPQEANFIARDLYDLIKQKGPLTVSDAWVQAQVLSHSPLILWHIYLYEVNEIILRLYILLGCLFMPS